MVCSDGGFFRPARIALRWFDGAFLLQYGIGPRQRMAEGRPYSDPRMEVAPDALHQRISRGERPNFFCGGQPRIPAAAVAARHNSGLTKEIRCIYISAGESCFQSHPFLPNVTVFPHRELLDISRILSPLKIDGDASDDAAITHIGLQVESRCLIEERYRKKSGFGNSISSSCKMSKVV